jgi:hypothetical protein
VSRDRDVCAVLDHPSRPASAGRETPQGGRSGGTTRPRAPVADNARDALTQQLAFGRRSCNVQFLLPANQGDGVPVDVRLGCFARLGRRAAAG